MHAPNVPWDLLSYEELSSAALPPYTQLPTGVGWFLCVGRTYGCVFQNLFRLAFIAVRFGLAGMD